MQRVLVVGDLPELAAGSPATPDLPHPLVLAGTAAEALHALRLAREAGPPSAVAAMITAVGLPDLAVGRFLDAVRQIDPDLPLLIAGTPDELAAVAPADAEHLFGVLVRPVVPVVVSASVRAAVEHRRLRAGEQDVLGRTLTAAMDVLVETLALASPLAYRRTSRVRLLTEQVATSLGVQDDWRLHVAAILSQIGCFAVPGSVLSKVEDTVRLSSGERQMFVGSLGLASHLLGQVPRLEEVAGWVGGQTVEFDQLGLREERDRPSPRGPAGPHELPRACFEVISAFLAGYDAGLAPGEIARRLAESGRYPVEVVDAVRQASGVLTPKGSPEWVSIEQVRAGMVLNGDVTTDAGLLLMRRGERVTALIEQRLRNFASSVGVAQPIAVLVTLPSPSARPATRSGARPAGRPAAGRASGRTATRTVKSGAAGPDDLLASRRSATAPVPESPAGG